jgi:hypothetical protein
MTFFDVSVNLTEFVNVTKTQAGSPLHAGFSLCYNALDYSLPQASLIQNYCLTDFATYTTLGANPTNQSCAVVLNNQTCSSCTVSQCNATNPSESADSFDCSNVESNAIVDNICGGNSIFKQFFASVYPTSEPTSFPTFLPTIAASTIDTTKPKFVSSAPSPIIVLGSNQPSSNGASFNGNNSSKTLGRSSARSLSIAWSGMSLLASGLVGFGLGMN